jgi:DNA invertase Pin-like site-specific DNA recombinase
MGKRAVIYVRTSSEQQGEKNSPVEQEADCRAFAEKQGLVVVNVYRDIERYRVKNKWVEPSGTRYDRPGLLAMLRDAADDQFDVILAWREDRLYRGMRAMLLVLETIQQHHLTIMLSQETFDPATAPLKAWLAQVELENIKERMTMGVKARLKAGKANSGQDRYGYRRNGEIIEIAPEEAKWVRQILTWYVEGVPDSTMRKRLIAANAPQKEDTTGTRRILWSLSSIKGVLAGAKVYATGVKIQRREGESFKIPVPPILDMKTYERYLEIKQKNKRFPRDIPLDDFLVRGLLYCPCQYKMRTSLSSTSRKMKAPFDQILTGSYQCSCRHTELISAECPRHVDSQVADADVWHQVCSVINDPALLIEQARKIVVELQKSSTDMSSNRERIEKELDALFSNRQLAITRARKGGMTVQELDEMLSEMSLQEASLKRELTVLAEPVVADSLDQWEAHLNQYLADMQEGIEALNRTPGNFAEEREINSLKRRAIETLVEKVNVDKELQFTVTIRLNMLQILENTSDQGGSQSSSGGEVWPNGKVGRRPNPSKRKVNKARMGVVRVSAIWHA